MNSTEFNPDGLVQSSQYAQRMQNAILPFLEKQRSVRVLNPDHRGKIWTESYLAEKSEGTVLIVHGFTENAFKYSELIYSLLQNHFSVIAYDQRGHGRSFRKPDIKDLSVTHIDSFEEYVQDLDAVCTALLPDMPKPWYIFSHSMGGAVASLYLETHHDTFTKAVFCAPMIAPCLNGLPESLALGVCRIAGMLHRADHRVFFIQPYKGAEDFQTSCATDFQRFSWYDSVKQSNSVYQNSCPTYSWVRESILVTKKILAAGMPESISCPVLLFTADRDSSVMPEPQKRFIERVPLGKHVFVGKSKHEIYRSENEVLYPWWHTILDFYRGK